jgi:large subunit ribosomal protein LP1
MSLSATGGERDQFVVSLAALVVADAGQDVSADNINAVINASGNKVASYWAPLFSTYIEKAGGVNKFFSGPGSGGGGGSAPAAAPGDLKNIFFFLIFFPRFSKFKFFNLN